MASMSQADQGLSVPSSLDDVVTSIRNSVLLLMSTFGAFLFVLGLFIDTITTVQMRNWRIWAAIFAVWGTALFFLGLILYTVIWWQRQ